MEKLNLTVEQNSPREVFVKKEFLSQIESGAKTCELRIAYESFLRLKTGQILEFKSSQENRSVKVKVLAVRQHANLESIIEKEDIDKIAPEISKDQILSAFAQAFNEADVNKYGLVVIEFEKII